VPQVFVFREGAVADAILDNGVTTGGDATGQIALVEQVSDRLGNAHTRCRLLLLVPAWSLAFFWFRLVAIVVVMACFNAFYPLGALFVELVLVATPLGVSRQTLGDRADRFGECLSFQGRAAVDNVVKDVRSQRASPQQVVRLSRSSPTSLNFRIQIANEFSSVFGEPSIKLALAGL